MALSGLAIFGWSGALALTTLHCPVGPQEHARRDAQYRDRAGAFRQFLSTGLGEPRVLLVLCAQF
jgi:hypothetical protein